jgi:D-alanyl-D-alanine carboxypeptidase/D-alanyl-D-alanine-endopeptidase (penicillin-binding protein 4)
VAEGDGRHSESAPESRSRAVPRRLWRALPALLVVVVLLAAGVVHVLDLGWKDPSPVTEPAKVEPPPSLVLPAARSAPTAAGEDFDAAADPARVRRAVARLVKDKSLGRHVALAVQQVADGTPVYDTGAGSVTPASTMKLLTTMAALDTLGASHRFLTRVTAGENPREIVLVGGGDPLLERAPSDDHPYPARADLDTLARATAKRLEDLGRSRVRLRYDTSLFSGPSVSPAWRDSYVPDDVVSRISPLWVDQGRDENQQTVEKPAAAAARAFAASLEKRGITVLRKPRPGAAPADAPDLAVVRGAPLEQVVQYVLEVSDNEGAEVLFRHVALAEGRSGSFRGGAKAVTGVLGELGVDTSGGTILDGSGLSRRNRLSPATLLAVLTTAASPDHPGLRPVVSTLPVAGFTGSLATRFETADDAGLGRVRAKTGTLSGVHGLAGVTTTRDGVPLAFVVVADKVALPDTLDARATLDEIAGALSACRCGA